MPQLPRIEPGSTKMTTASPNRRLDPVAESQPGRDVQALGQATAKLGFRLQAVQDSQERTRAQNDYNKRANALKIQQRDDLDYSPERKQYYTEELNKAKQLSLASVSNPFRKGQLSEDLNYNVNMDTMHISDNMNTKMISASAADRADFVNTQFQNYAVAPDDAGRKLYKNKILDSYKEALSNIEINPVEYGEKVRNLDLELGKSRANYDIYVGDPIKAAKNLDEGAYGIKDEDPKVWAGYKDAAIAEYKKRQTTNRLNTLISQNEKTAELTKRVFAGEALPQEVYKYRALEWIDDGTKSALIKYIESSKEVDPSAESSAYGELVADFQLLELTNTNIAVSDRLVGLAKFRKKVVEFRTAGKMTQSTADNFTDLINFAFTPTSEKKNGEPTGNIEGINKEIKNKYNNTRKALGLTRWWRLDIADNARIKKVKAKVYNLIMNADKIGTFNREELDAFVDDAIKTELADAMMDYNYNSPDVTTVNGDVYTKGDTKVIKGINYEYKGNGKWKKIS